MQILLAKKVHIPKILDLINRREKIEGKNSNAMAFILESINQKLCWIIEHEGKIIGISNGFEDYIKSNENYKIFYWMNLYIDENHRNGLIFKWFCGKLESQIYDRGFDIIMALVWRPDVIKLHKSNKYQVKRKFYLNFIFPFMNLDTACILPSLINRSVLNFKKDNFKIDRVNIIKYNNKISVKILQDNRELKILYPFIYFPLFYLNSKRSFFTVREYSLLLKSLTGFDASSVLNDLSLEAGDHDAL